MSTTIALAVEEDPQLAQKGYSLRDQRILCGIGFAMMIAFVVCVTKDDTHGYTTSTWSMLRTYLYAALGWGGIFAICVAWIRPHCKTIARAALTLLFIWATALAAIYQLVGN